MKRRTVWFKNKFQPLTSRLKKCKISNVKTATKTNNCIEIMQQGSSHSVRQMLERRTKPTDTQKIKAAMQTPLSSDQCWE